MPLAWMFFLIALSWRENHEKQESLDGTGKDAGVRIDDSLVRYRRNTAAADRLCWEIILCFPVRYITDDFGIFRFRDFYRRNAFSYYPAA